MNREMRRCVWLLPLLSVGCLSAQQERLQVYNNDGVYLFQRGDFVGAHDDFQAALALKPNDPALLYNLGQCCDRIGDTKKAENYYGLCLQMAPNHADCRHAYAALMLREGRRDETVNFVEGWLAREPKLAAAYAEDGWLWHQLGDLTKAQGRLSQALSIDPHDLHALIESARLYESMHRPDRAAALYERALDRDPHQAELVSRLNALRSQGIGIPHPD
jgi:tetratricopeptide (TPR) repeat protein